MTIFRGLLKALVAFAVFGMVMTYLATKDEGVRSVVTVVTHQ